MKGSMYGAVKVIAIMGLFMVAGCASPGPIVSSERAHVLILPGCNGSTKKVDRLRDMIDSEVDETSAQIWDWTDILPATLHINQWDIWRNRYRVKLLVRELNKWREQNPDTKLYVLGFSGGAAIALWAAEGVDENFGLERIVLIGGSVAPDYDLTPTLERTNIGVFNYFSLADTVFLREGTIWNGTMERKFTISAGYSGFEVPADERLAAKLEQFEWTPSMKALGNNGGHWGPFSEPFIRKYLLDLFAEPASLTRHAKLSEREEPEHQTQGSGTH